MSNDIFTFNNSSSLEYEKSYWRFLYIGIIIYACGSVLSINREGTVINIILLVGSVFSFFSLIKLVKVLPHSKWLRFWLILFLLWSFVTVIRSFKFDIVLFKQIFTSKELFLPYLLPLVLLSRYCDVRISQVIRYILILNVIFIVFSFLFSSEISNKYSFDFMEVLNKFMMYSNCFLLLTLSYYPKKIKLFVVFVFFVGLYFAIIQARRNQIYTLGLFGFFSFIMVIRQLNVKSYLKYISAIFGFIFIALVISLLINQFKEGIFEKILTRGLQDTRSFVEIEYWRDMDLFSLIFGKGMDGKFYCPALYGWDTDVDRMRSGIETGYLYLILKMGLIGFLMFLIISLSAIIKGFRSNNFFTKSCSLYVLVYLLEQYPAGNPLYTMRLLVFWLCVGYCFSDTIRKMKDADIKELINLNLLPKIKFRINE